MRTANDIRAIYRHMKRKIAARNYSKAHPLTGEALERKRRRDVEKVMRVYNGRKSRGHCVRCDTNAVTLVYEYLGQKLLTRTSLYCPKHWESPTIRKEMSDAISTHTTIHTVHPVVTLRNQSNVRIAG